MTGPTDWDGESYCVEPECSNPATHRRLNGMIDDYPLYDLVCCHHTSNP